MDTRRLAVVLGFAWLVVGHSLRLQAAEVAPVEAFGAIPQVSDVELSPDGNLLAWHDERGATPAFVIYDLAARKFVRGTALADLATLRSLHWADNETLLVTVSARLKYRGETRNSPHFTQWRTFAADVSGGNDRMLLMTGNRTLVTGADLLAWRTPKPKTVIMSTWDYSETSARMETGSRLNGGRAYDGWVAQVFEVDTRSGTGSHLESGTPFTEDWVVDLTGKVVARSEWNPKTEVYTIVARNGRGWREILRQEHMGERSLHGLAPDGSAIIVSARRDKGIEILETLPLDGSPGKPLLEDQAGDISYVIYDDFTRSAVGVALGGLEESLHWFDPQAEHLYQSAAQAFPGKRVSIRGRSEDSRRVLVAVDGPAAPTIYYVIDFVTHKADMVGEEYPQLAGVTLGEVRPITYKAHDGTMIPAYLTLPPGSDGKNLPLVLLPHGGPEARDDYAFDWWAQFLASRGYAVLQPQFRGSTGFGYEWSEAGYGEWGKLMQDDLTDGVKALIEQGVADAKRVCIVGASYGGYAALAGAAFTPELFRCAVSVNGVSDLPGMLGFARKRGGEESDTLAYWRDHIGAPNDPEVIQKSPLRAAAQVKAPVLLIHATNDTVVPPYQSEVIAQALAKAGKPVTLVKLDGEDHWLSKTVTRVQVLKEIEKFLDASLHQEP